MKKKQTKAQKFRQLLPEIELLLEEYLQETVVDILREQHDLDISLNTFKNYLYRYKSDDKVQAIMTEPNIQRDKEDIESSNEQILDDEISKDILEKLRNNLNQDKKTLDKTASIHKSIFNK